MIPWTDSTLLATLAGTAAVAALLTRFSCKRRERELLAAADAEKDAREALAQDFTIAQVELGKLQGLVSGLEKARDDVQVVRNQLKAEFAEVAGQALTATSSQFLELADAKLQTREKGFSAELERRQAVIDETIKPLQGELSRISQLTRDLDGKRENAMGSLVTKLTQIDEATNKLREQSQALTETLRGNVRVRGRWGEQTLRRLAELGGLVDQCDFVEQQGTAEARPDMVVRMPDQGQVPIDAKAPLEHFLRAHESKDAKEREQALRQHAEAVRGHIRALAKRDYPSQLDQKLGLTVMFLPTEPMLAVAIEQLPELFEEAQRSRVLLATPMTLLAMLKTIAIFWHQHRMVENASQIVDVARELYQRISTFQEHLTKVGKGLQSAGDAFNAATSSFNQRVVPQGRKLEEIGGAAAARKELAELEEVTSMPRPVLIPLPAKPLNATGVGKVDAAS